MRHLYSPSCREGQFSNACPTCLCSVVHEYSARVTNRNKLKCLEYQLLRQGGQEVAENGQRKATVVAMPLENGCFYAER